ncbi:MAG: hypothetical protein J6J53_04050 [Muribaculaceae bacterium]|nr:hypothetical protein [Muribaculaceae bacterium]
MKKFYYIAMLLSLAATNVAAEEFLPILEPGKEWVYEWKKQVSHGVFEFLNRKESVSDRTETVEGRLCTVVDITPIDYEGTPSTRLCTEENGVFSYFYKFDERLEIPDRTGQFIPEVDFKVKEGEMVPAWDPSGRETGEIVKLDNWGYTVESVDVIEVKGIKRRRITFGNISPELTKGYWVEGIGANYTEMFILWPFCTCGYRDYYKIKECYKDGECIFTEADFHAPALTELREIEASDKAADGALYDLSGRRVDHPRRGQIYVSNGRKLRF